VITSSDKILRLVMPQWQGGNNPNYHFGAQLLACIAPDTTGPIEHIAVKPPDGRPVAVQDGIVGKGELLVQLDAARAALTKHAPDAVVVLGGDCLVDLAPFAYLNERYDGDLAILWIDAHPDVMDASQFAHAHAHVLGLLLGHGDADFLRAVPRRFAPANVMYAGLGKVSDFEADFLTKFALAKAGPEALATTSEPILEWLRNLGARHVAIHFDLDVLSPNAYNFILFNSPDAPPDAFAGITRGEMTLAQIVRLINDVAGIARVVGLGITEHLPWDAIQLRRALASLPLIGAEKATAP
jgi:arginase